MPKETKNPPTKFQSNKKLLKKVIQTKDDSNQSEISQEKSDLSLIDFQKKSYNFSQESTKILDESNLEITNDKKKIESKTNLVVLKNHKKTSKIAIINKKISKSKSKHILESLNKMYKNFSLFENLNTLKSFYKSGDKLFRKVFTKKNKLKSDLLLQKTQSFSKSLNEISFTLKFLQPTNKYEKEYWYQSENPNKDIINFAKESDHKICKNNVEKEILVEIMYEYNKTTQENIKTYQGYALVTYKNSIFYYKRHNFGRIIYSDKTIYIGYFENGLKNGFGIQKNFASKHVYCGFWKENKYNGCGLSIWQDGDFYKGEYINGMKSGHGEFFWNDQEQYKGKFENNEINGFGEYKWPNGNSYIGYFKNALKNGKGIFLSNQGYKFTGNFIEGYKNGFGEVFFGNGAIFQGFFTDSLVFGNCTAINEGGKYKNLKVERLPLQLIYEIVNFN